MYQLRGGGGGKREIDKGRMALEAGPGQLDGGKQNRDRTDGGGDISYLLYYNKYPRGRELGAAEGRKTKDGLDPTIIGSLVIFDLPCRPASFCDCQNVIEGSRGEWDIHKRESSLVFSFLTHIKWARWSLIKTVDRALRGNANTKLLCFAGRDARPPRQEGFSFEAGQLVGKMSRNKKKDKKPSGIGL